MAAVFSFKRKSCADYFERHKRRVYRNRRFRYVTDLNVDALKMILPPSKAAALALDDVLCQNCFQYTGEKLSSSVSDPCSSSPASCIEEHEVVEGLNEEISAAGLETTPLRMPSTVNPKSRQAYAERKQREIEGSHSRQVRKKLATAYTLEPSGSSSRSDQPCLGCDGWWANIGEAFVKAASYQERCQLLTLVPKGVATREVERLIPEASKYLLKKSKQLRERFGVWERPEPYHGGSISEDTIRAATHYYTDDDLDCSRQSPNKKDAVKLLKDGEEHVVVKRYMTRSVRETYRLFKEANPDSKLGLTKFYSLRPKWVKLNPEQTVCACVCCTNFDLCFSTLNSMREEKITKEEILALCLCPEPSSECFRGECKDCPSTDRLSLESLEMVPEEEITFFTWENGNLISKTADSSAFLKELQKWATRFSTHDFIRRTQREAIRIEKSSVTSRHIVMHFDFAENWTVILPHEIQEYHWHKRQLSVFTCVASTSQGSKCFGVVCEDLCHDTSHALLALRLIEDWLEEHIPVYASLTYISDGAPAHFKNRFQLHEFERVGHTQLKWIFSASGHGKNSCDGVGGLLKHHATVHNLRSPEERLVRTSVDFVDKVGRRVKNVTLMNLTEKEVSDFRRIKKTEWSCVPTRKGIRASHVWRRERGEVQLERTVLSSS
ncbi:unnamed protein product [Ixodes pacificus]